MQSELPVAIVGGGPVGLTAALGLLHHGVRVILFEEDDALSLDTKAGTTLSRTLEIWRRYGVAERILAGALRIDEIGEIERATGRARLSVRLDVLDRETRYPFVINMPQHHFEPHLAAAVREGSPETIRLGHRLIGFEQQPDRVILRLATPHGEERFEAAFLLACDGGRSLVRERLGIDTSGHSLPERYVLVDLEIDLDIANPRDYPYLAYFADPREWMILVRQPHCWRFLFPLPPDAPEPSAESLRDKVLEFIGTVDAVRVLGMNAYRVHHRVASRWRDHRIFLMGDAAHLITPMWALGLNTGVLDASNLPWRIAWYLRGWADETVLDGYEREQLPVAVHGSGEMAEAARRNMAHRSESTAMTANNWGNAYTRALLGVRLDVAGGGNGSMVKTETEPPVVAGDRLPDAIVHGPQAREARIHDFIAGRFVALYFADARRRPLVPANASPALAHYVVSRWDPPMDSGLRDRALLDPGDHLFRRLGIPPDSVVLVRPDEHVAAIAPIESGAAGRLYQAVTGRPPAG